MVLANCHIFRISESNLQTVVESDLTESLAAFQHLPMKFNTSPNSSFQARELVPGDLAVHYPSNFLDLCQSLLFLLAWTSRAPRSRIVLVHESGDSVGWRSRRWT